MFWFKLIKNFFRLLQSNVSPVEIAGGVALGAIIGLTPFFTLHNLFVFLLVILLNVNIASVFFSIIIFGIIGYLTDILAHQIGYLLLVKLEFLNSFWTALYNAPVVPLTRFYNTVVLGSLVISIVMFIPIFVGTKKFVIVYRSSIAKKVEKWKIVKVMKLSKIYKIYKKFSP